MNQEPGTGRITPTKTVVGGVTACVAVVLLAAASAAQPVGTCEPGQASADLSVNRVTAQLYNNGGLFWKGAGPRYNVPNDTPVHALFAHGIWIGGLIDGELRTIASDYGPWELWPGPLDANANPPEDCSIYDRMYSVNRSDILHYDRTGQASDDLRDWPYQLGAPVVDGDGNPDNYNLKRGDRPKILGDQTIWWLMNDGGNNHDWSLTKPLQLEIRVTAYAMAGPPPLGFTTLYQYELTNRGAKPIEQTWFGNWVDPDLGNAGDDYVGCDSALGLAFAYNGDEFDESTFGYGSPPPAIGFAFVQGPSIPPDGVDNDHDGEIDEPGERLSMTTFVYYNSGQTEQGNPNGGSDAYRYMRALWRDDQPITYGGSGRGFSEEPTKFVFSGEPGEFWSEEDIDGEGHRNTPADRRFLTSTGPFTIEPGETQQITYAIVFSAGIDRLDSVRKLKEDTEEIQLLFDGGFATPEPPDAPVVTATPLDGSLIIAWDNGPDSNNYLDGFEVDDPLLARSKGTKSYRLEGYNVFRFESAVDTVGSRMATFDRVNGVRRVIDPIGFDGELFAELLGVTAWGTDSAIRHEIRIDSLTNYQTYHFGVQAYAYSENSYVHVLKSPIARISAQPSSVAARRGGTIVADTLFGTELSLNNGAIKRQGRGGGTVDATIVDPTAVTGHTYRLDFITSRYASELGREYASTYTLVDESTGKIKFDGAEAESIWGRPLSQEGDAFILDGLSVSVASPAPGALDFDTDNFDESWAAVQVQGTGDNDACGPGAGSTFGCEETGGNWVYRSFNGSIEWITYHSGDGWEHVIGDNAPHDFELRATAEGSYAYGLFDNGEIIRVPFEIWDIGINGTVRENDPADDRQIIAVILFDQLRNEWGPPCTFGFNRKNEDPFGLGWATTDRIYAYYPTEGYTYEDWAAAAIPLVETGGRDGCPISPETDAARELIDTSDRVLQRFIISMDPTSPNYNGTFIPEGNIIRFLTTKPNLPGDTFWIQTAGFEPKTNDLQTAKEALDRISIVPNPYKGVSAYELSTIRDAVRFTNLPDVATIRIYNLAGTLMTQLEKTPATTGLEWDLTNGDGHHISSGMYLVHVDVPGVGERVFKFGMIKKKR